MTSAVPEMTRIWLVSFFSCFVSGVSASVSCDEHVRDVADLGRHPGRGDDEARRRPWSRSCSCRPCRSGRRAACRLAVTVSAPFATGMLSPVSADSATSSVAAFSSAPVGGDDVAGLDRDDVARNELLGRNLDELAAAAHLRLDDHHLLQRGDGRGRLPLLVQAEHGVEQRQEEQDEAGAELVQRLDAADAGDEQDDLHRVAVLAHERAPARLGLGGDESVRAVLLEPCRGFGRRRARPARRCRAPGRRRRSRARTTASRRAGRGLALRSSPSLHPPRWSVPPRGRPWCPESPCSTASISAIEPIAAVPPVLSTNMHAASTFGPIEPSANSPAASSAGVARRIACWSGVPQSA